VAPLLSSTVRQTGTSLVQMRFNVTVLVGLLLIWTGEAGSAERALYLLSELSQSTRQEYGAELPAEYAGIWFVRSQHPLPSGAVELERPAGTVCIASGPGSAYIRIHVADKRATLRLRGPPIYKSRDRPVASFSADWQSEDFGRPRSRKPP
jgi:hypothetical protein